MSPEELAQIKDLVAQIGQEIQPLLHPHPELARRNAFAHIWLGLKMRFGEYWRESGKGTEILNFLEWIRCNPNADYEVYAGAVTRCDVPRDIPESGLFDGLG